MAFAVKILVGVSSLRLSKLTSISIKLLKADPPFSQEVTPFTEDRVAPKTLKHTFPTSRIHIVGWIRERIAVEVQPTGLPDRIRLEIPSGLRIVGTEEVGVSYRRVVIQK